MSTVHELIDLAARHFGADAAALSPGDDLFASLGIDSVKALELMTELELEWDIEIPDYELREVKTFADLAAVCDRRR